MSRPSQDSGPAPLGVGDLIGLARLDFGVFAVVMFPELHDGKQMVPAPYVNLMVEALMAVGDGAEKRLIFNLPPGHMKSLIISVLFSAWLLGVEPSKRILCVSYGDDLTRQLSRLTRRVMISPLYRRIFPKTILAKQAEDLLTTTKGGQRVSGLKVRRFHNAMPAMYDGLVRLPTTMPGLETLLAEFAAFPDGRNDDQVDAVCNVAANRELIIHRARLFGERLGRIRPIPRVVPPAPPKSWNQELYDRRRQFRD